MWVKLKADGVEAESLCVVWGHVWLGDGEGVCR